jgi:hypothetical protein
MVRNRLLTSILAIGLCACETPTRPALVETVHAQPLPASSGGAYDFPSGAGMFMEGHWLLIRGERSATPSPVALQGKIYLTSTEGSGVRRLCVDRNNAVIVCSDSDEIAALRREIQELRAHLHR